MKRRRFFPKPPYVFRVDWSPQVAWLIVVGAVGALWLGAELVLR